MVKYVVFDFDGTLADSRMVFVSAWNSLAKKYSFNEMKLEELDTIRKLTIKERCKLLNCPMYRIPLIIPPLYKLYRQSIQEVKLYDKVKEMLKGLEDRGIKVAIISSNSEDNIKNFLSRNEIKSIDRILCSSRIFGKDRLMRKFLKEHKLSTSEVIYVGDEHRDIVASKKVGIKMIWVSWGFDAEEVIESVGPDYRVYGPEEILQVI